MYSLLYWLSDASKVKCKDIFIYLFFCLWKMENGSTVEKSMRMVKKYILVCPWETNSQAEAYVNIYPASFPRHFPEMSSLWFSAVHYVPHESFIVPSIKTLMAEGSASQVVPLLAVSNYITVWERNIFQLCIFKAMKRGGLAVWRAAEQFFESAPPPPILLRSSSSSYHENISIRATQTRPHSLPVVLAHSTVVRQHLACWNDSTKGFLLRYPADAVFG